MGQEMMRPMEIIQSPSHALARLLAKARHTKTSSNVQMARRDIVLPTKNAMQLKHSLMGNGAKDVEYRASALLLALER